MTKEALFSAIGDLDETVIAEPETIAAKNRTGLKAAAVTLACAACLGLVLIGVIKWRVPGSADTLPDIPPQLMSEPTHATEPPVSEQKHYITFLHAIADGSQKTKLIENVRFPYRTLIRLRDISGMDDEQFSVVYKEEQNFMDGLFSQYPEEARNWGRYRGKDVLITTISAGSFILQLNDPEAVKSVEISVTNMGYVSLLPRIESYRCVANNRHNIYLDEKAIEQAIQPSVGGLTMFWQISNQVASMIKEDPSLPLSSIQDTITVRICLKDGSEEACSVDMIVEDSGDVYAIFRGRTVTT